MSSIEHGRSGIGEGGDRDVVVTRSEERLTISTTRVPVRRAIVRRVVVSEERTMTVTVRREELRVDYEDLTGNTLAAPAVEAAPIDLVLHEEQVEVVTRVVPVERVHVDVLRVGLEQEVAAEVRSERIEVDGVPLR